MTTEAMERAAELSLKHQAGFEARIATTEAQLEKTSRQVETLAAVQTEFTQFVRSNLEALNEVSRELRETVRAPTISQAPTDEPLSDLEEQG